MNKPIEPSMNIHMSKKPKQWKIADRSLGDGDFLAKAFIHRKYIPHIFDA